MRRPSTITVHAPHWPWSQPFFVPVSCRCSRNASSSVVRVSTSSDRVVPLTSNVTCAVGTAAPGGATGSATACADDGSGDVAAQPAVAASEAAPAIRNSRREKVKSSSGLIGWEEIRALEWGGTAPASSRLCGATTR